MDKQPDHFLLPWKDLANIDDFLAKQIDQIVRRIRSRYE